MNIISFGVVTIKKARNLHSDWVPLVYASVS